MAGLNRSKGLMIFNGLPLKISEDLSLKLLWLEILPYFTVKTPVARLFKKKWRGGGGGGGGRLL